MMARRGVVVDTNVPIVANGRSDPDVNGKLPSIACRLATVERLERVLDQEQVLLDEAGEILKEYHRRLNPRGQPGVGDRFYQEVLRFHPDRVRQVDLPRRADGSFEDFPDDACLAGFDPSDRKFAALARREAAPVLNVTDTDWVQHLAELKNAGVEVELICGCNPATFTT